MSDLLTRTTEALREARDALRTGWLKEAAIARIESLLHEYEHGKEGASVSPSLFGRMVEVLREDQDTFSNLQYRIANGDDETPEGLKRDEDWIGRIGIAIRRIDALLAEAAQPASFYPSNVTITPLCRADDIEALREALEDTTRMLGVIKGNLGEYTEARSMIEGRISLNRAVLTEKRK